mmetsp:Transcript_52564/g.161789  ORF Transcript_52564/g.161789 Transcript_52564/m.161789 type:complete len:211 (+) Transcript_52564:686-1318(+)
MHVAAMLAWFAVWYRTVTICGLEKLRRTKSTLPYTSHRTKMSASGASSGTMASDRYGVLPPEPPPRPPRPPAAPRPPRAPKPLSRPPMPPPPRPRMPTWTESPPGNWPGPAMGTRPCGVMMYWVPIAGIDIMGIGCGPGLSDGRICAGIMGICGGWNCCGCGCCGHCGCWYWGCCCGICICWNCCCGCPKPCGAWANCICGWNCCCCGCC